MEEKKFSELECHSDIKCVGDVIVKSTTQEKVF